MSAHPFQPSRPAADRFRPLTFDDMSGVLYFLPKVTWPGQGGYDLTSHYASVEKSSAKKINKFFEQNCLLEQEFCVNPDFKVEKYLESKGVKLVEYVRFEKGEGLEKKEDNFADEVASMIK